MKSILKVALTSLAIVPLLVGATPAVAADEARIVRTKMYLKIDGIPGESTAANHAGEIEIMSWSFGGVNTDTGGGGGGGGSGKFEPTDLTITKLTGTASPLLLQKVATGEHLREVLLTQEPVRRNPRPFLTIELEDVLISSYQAGGTNENAAPTEQISLTYNKITMSVYPKNGGPAVVFCWQKSGLVCPA